MKKIIFSIVAIFTLAIGLSYVYADEATVEVPFEYQTISCTVQTETTAEGTFNAYHCTWIGEIPFGFSIAFIPGEIELTEEPEISDDVKIIIRDPAPEVSDLEKEADKLGIPVEALKRLKEKEAELNKMAEEALTCIMGIEGSSLFTEYRELMVLKQMTYFKQLPLGGQEKQIILWTEECRTWSESYLSNYRQYQDIFKDQQRNPAYSKVLDETDSAFTDPLTPEDFADEIEDAERYMCSVEGKQRGLCIKEFSGLNRGGYTEGADCVTQMGKTMCPLKDYNALISSAISAEENYDTIQELVCEKYMNQYSALVERIRSGDETAQLPNWLAHCEVT